MDIAEFNERQRMKGRQPATRAPNDPPGPHDIPKAIIPEPEVAPAPLFDATKKPEPAHAWKPDPPKGH